LNHDILTKDSKIFLHKFLIFVALVAVLIAILYKLEPEYIPDYSSPNPQ